MRQASCFFFVSSSVFFYHPTLSKTKISEAKIFGETRINSGYILTFIVVYGRIYSVLQVPVEHHIRWRLLPLIGNADSFCLPERGGDANVRYVGAVVLACRTHYSTFNIH